MNESESESTYPFYTDVIYRILLDVDVSYWLKDSGKCRQIMTYELVFLISWASMICASAIIALTYLSKVNSKYNLYLLITAIISEVIRRIASSMGAALIRERDCRVDEARRLKDEARRQKDHLQIIALLQQLQQNGVNVNQDQLAAMTTNVERDIAQSIKQEFQAQAIEAITQSFDRQMDKYDVQLRFSPFDQLTMSERNIAIPRSGSN